MFTCIQSFFSSSVLQRHKDTGNQSEDMTVTSVPLVRRRCAYLACSSRDLCFPDTRNVLGTATLLVSFSWTERDRGTALIRGHDDAHQQSAFGVPHLHPVHIDASTDAVLLTDQTQLRDAVQQAVVELRRERRDVLRRHRQHSRAGQSGGLWSTSMRYLSCVVPFLLDSFRMCPSLMSSFVGLTMSSSPPNNSYTFSNFLIRS